MIRALQAPSHVKKSQCAAVAGFERIERKVISAKQIVADAEPNSGRRAAILAGFQFIDCLAQRAMGSGILAQCVGKMAYFLRAERAVVEHDLFDVNV